MEWIITANRSSVLAVVVVLLSLAFSLGAGELVARLSGKVPRMDRVQVYDPDRPDTEGVVFDCYPRFGDVRMPIDLETAEGRAGFLKAFPGKVVAPGLLGVGELPGMEALTRPVPSSFAMDLLVREVPLCNSLERGMDSPRHLATPPGFDDSVALLGDSFVFGQGLTSEDTIVHRLAGLLHARVRSYAFPGANIGEVRQQFEDALREQGRFHYSKIIYFFVLNDTYSSPALDDQLNGLLDFVNLRLRHVGKSSRLLKSLADYSMLFRLALFQYSRLVVSRETVAWYRDLNDPARNEGVLKTFKTIKAMSDGARTRGLEFVVMLYPLMLDMRNYPLADVHEKFGELAKQRGIEFHDLLPAFRARAADRTLVVHPIDLHPNAYAQSLAAEDVAEYLRGRARR